MAEWTVSRGLVARTNSLQRGIAGFRPAVALPLWGRHSNQTRNREADRDITTHAEPRWSRATVWLSAAVLLCALAWLGHRLVFAQFQDYDDEGYLLLTVQQFLHGLPLYDQV